MAQEATQEAWMDEEMEGGGTEGRKSKRPARIVVTALLLFLGAFVLLFFNERRAVRFYQSIGVGEGAVTSVRMDRIDPTNDGKLVHVTGLATTGEILTDPVYGVSANAIRFRRDVRVYKPVAGARDEPQEEGETGAGSSDREAQGIWSEPDNEINRSLLAVDEPRNRSFRPFARWKAEAQRVTLGAFFLPTQLVEQLDRFRPMTLSESDRENLPAEIRYQAILDKGELFFGADPGSPEVGDIRVGYSVLEPTTVTVVAQQTGNTFGPYPAASGPLMLLKTGAHSPEHILRKAPEENVLVTWGLRGLGLLMMWGGLWLLLKNSITAFMMAVALSFMTIAITWFIPRPILSAVLLTAAVAVLAGMRMLPGVPEPGSELAL